MPVPAEPDRVPTRGRGRGGGGIAAVAGVALIATAVVIAATGGHGDGRARRSRVLRPVPVEVLGEQVTRTPSAPASVPTTVASTTTTTTTTTVATPIVAAPPAVTTTCADALAYLAAHQAPGFRDLCADGSAFGHLGVTCVNAAGMCPGTRFVHIACPAPFVYMNEAHNSWVLIGTRTGIDPYGQGTDAQRAACASHR